MLCCHKLEMKYVWFAFTFHEEATSKWLQCGIEGALVCAVYGLLRLWQVSSIA